MFSVESIKARAVALASGARRSLLAALVVGTLLLAGWALSRSVPHDGLHLFARNSTVVVRRSAVPAEMSGLPTPPMVQPVKAAAIAQVPAEHPPVKPSLPKSSSPPSVRAKHHVPDLEIENTLAGDSGVLVFEDTGVKGASTTSHDSGARSASALITSRDRSRANGPRARRRPRRARISGHGKGPSYSRDRGARCSGRRGWKSSATQSGTRISQAGGCSCRCSQTVAI